MKIAINAGIDESDAVFLSLGDGHLEVLATTIGVFHGAVNQDVVWGWRAGQRVLCSFIQHKGREVVKIGHW